MYHSLLLKYCPKRLHFHKGGMQTRIQLSVMDHNNNLGRQQATTKDGEHIIIATFKIHISDAIVGQPSPVDEFLI